MKVVMVNGSYGGVSGSGRGVKLLSEELMKRGVKVYLCTNNVVGYINIPKLKSISFATIAKFKLRPKYDVIHVHNPKFSIVTKKDLPNVLTIHGDYIVEFSLMYGRLMSKLFDNWFRREMVKFKVTTCVSPYWSKLRGWRYIPNGLNLDEIREIEPSDERYVLFVGRKDKIKGYDLFEKAVRKLPYPYKMLGVHEKVPWKKVIAYMKSAYCLVLPSAQEGMPYVILEAWACGCPVIATNLPTLRSFGEGAIYFLKERTVSCIKGAIQTSVENKDVAEKLRKSGYKKIREFDIKKVAEKYVGIYEKLYL